MGTRKEMLERYRAIDTARNILTSKVGRVVMETNRFPDRQLGVNCGVIDREARKIKQDMDKKMKQFKSNTLLYTFEPTIIVERPPSPENLLFGFSATDAADLPGYMKPLASRTKTPSNLATIDAFTVKPRKKVNLWEEGYTKEDTVRFRSLLGGSPPLSDEEQVDLRKGWTVLRPLSRIEDQSRKRSGRRSGKQRRKLPAVTAAEPVSSTFITEMAGSPSHKDSEILDRKAVKFAQNLQQSRTISRVSRAPSSLNRPPQTAKNNKVLDSLQDKRTQPPTGGGKGPAEMPTLAEMRRRKNMKTFEKKCQALGIRPLGQSALDAVSN